MSKLHLRVGSVWFMPTNINAFLKELGWLFGIPVYRYTG